MKDDSVPLRPPGNHGQSRDDIAAEIADHLASAEGELAKRGMAAEEARAAARRGFGDVEKIKQACYWIQNGETIMLRWTLVSLAAVLCILLGLSVLGNWRAQSQLADEMGKLSAELKSLAAAKQTPPPAPQPPEITGVIYAGSKVKPLAGVNVAILRADGSVVRRTACDAKGVYHSGPLEPGDYCVTSPVHGASESMASWVTQSGPIFLHSGSGTFSCDLDTGFHSGAVRIVANRALPEFRKDGSYRIASRLSVAVMPTRHRYGLWTPAQDAPVAWPVFCLPTVVEEKANAFSRGDRLASWTSTLQLNQENIAEIREGKVLARYPVGKTEYAVMLSLTVIPIDEKGDALLLSERVREKNALLARLPDEKRALARTLSNPFLPVPWPLLENDWREISQGTLWIEHLQRSRAYPFDLTSPKSPPIETLEIQEDKVATLQVEIPEGVELEIQKGVETATDRKQFNDLIRNGLLQRPLKVTAVRYEPMADK